MPLDAHARATRTDGAHAAPFISYAYDTPTGAEDCRVLCLPVGEAARCVGAPAVLGLFQQSLLTNIAIARTSGSEDDFAPAPVDIRVADVQVLSPAAGV